MASSDKVIQPEVIGNSWTMDGLRAISRWSKTS